MAEINFTAEQVAALLAQERAANSDSPSLICEKHADRIAELESDLEQAHFDFRVLNGRAQCYKRLWQQNSEELNEARARIAELEAERPDASTLESVKVLVFVDEMVQIYGTKNAVGKVQRWINYSDEIIEELRKKVAELEAAQPDEQGMNWESAPRLKWDETHGAPTAWGTYINGKLMRVVQDPTNYKFLAVTPQSISFECHEDALRFGDIIAAAYEFLTAKKD